MPALACPICFRPFAFRTRGLSCISCNRTFPSRDYLDLTVSAGAQGTGSYAERAPTSQSLFQSPLVSFAYERGWRQSFAWAGFPGADSEFETAQRYMASARGGVVLDVSCGSGLFTRRFAASGAYRHVIASDFSDSMLTQAKTYLAEQSGLPTEVTFVRADVGRLPFPTGSIDAVHAGAALHCWPSPSAAVAEISRVLRPGGVFVASTFLTPAAPLGEVLGDATVAPLSQALAAQQQRFRWWSEPELRDLCAMMGLSSFERQRQRQFILLRAQKPGQLV